MARRNWEPTDQERHDVALYAGLGLTPVQVGNLIGPGITGKLITEKCGDDYNRGKAEMIAQIAGGLTQKALKGDKIAMIFYLKAQAGWKDTQSVEHTGVGGEALFPTAIEWNVQEPKQIEGRVRDRAIEFDEEREADTGD